MRRPARYLAPTALAAMLVAAIAMGVGAQEAPVAPDGSGSGAAVVPAPDGSGAAADPPNADGSGQASTATPIVALIAEGSGAEAPTRDGTESVAERIGATYRAVNEPAAAIADAVVARASQLAPPTQDPVVALLAAGSGASPELAEVLGVTPADLADAGTLAALLTSRRTLQVDAERRLADAAAGTRVLARRANAITAQPRARTSRLDPAWAMWRVQQALAREAVRRAAMEAWALEIEVSRRAAEVDYLTRRTAALQAAAPLDNDVVATSTATMQAEITEERQRLGTEAQRTSEIEADAERSRLVAAEALARAHTARERELASDAAAASAALAAIAGERREIEAIQESATTEKETFLVQQSDLRAQIAALIEAAEAGTPSRQQADELFARVNELRASTRIRAKELRPDFEARQAQIDELTVALRQARAALELVDQQESDPTLAASLRDVRAQQVDVAQRQLEVAEWRWDIERNAWVLARQQVYFFAQLNDRLVPYLRSGTRRDMYRLTVDNLVAEREKVTDRIIGLQLVTMDRVARFDDFTSWLSSAEGVTFVVKRLALLVAVILVVGTLYRRRCDLVSAVLRRLERVAFVRKHNAAVLKLAEMVRDTAHWIALFFGASMLLAGISSELPEVILVQQLLQKVVMYLAGIAVVRTAILPRAERGKSGNDARDIESFGIDLWQVPARTAHLVVLTLRVWLIYTIATSFASDVVSFALGRSFTANLIEKTFLWGQALLVYALVWYWRDIIVEQTIKLTGTEGSRAADALQRHKDRFYSGIGLALLATFVLVRVLWRLGRGWARDNSLARQLANFVFRKRVERARATTGEEASVDLDTIDESYRRLFDPRSGCEPEMYIRRSTELDALLRQFIRWNDTDAAASAAVVGEWGMGKTTLLDAFQRDVQTDLPMVRASLDRRIVSAADMVSWLAECLSIEDASDESALIERILSGDVRLAVIDNAHRCFVRSIHGFRALDVLLRVMSLTNRRVFWVLSFDVVGWRYLNRVRNRRHSFHTVVELAPLTDDQIQNLIERRNASAGITPRFTQLLDEAQDENIYAVIRTAAGYYRLLAEYAGGNPRLASHFWLESITPTADGVDVRLFQRPNSGDLARLSMAQRFALTALVQHDGLGIEHLQDVIAVDIEEVELDLETLHDHEIVKRRSAGEYRVSTRWYRAVLDDLRNRNLLVKS